VTDLAYDLRARTRELRLRERIDTLSDERDRLRLEAASLRRILAARNAAKDDRALIMRGLRAAGWSYPQIARALGCSTETVSYWCRPERRQEQQRKSIMRYHEARGG
jgi:DNA-directed RNA polymerase specialized sigma24 family protein